ncbi:hypothetical protein JOD64_002302 [Micromonospora luteifusca]|uniref:Glycine zipper domain-containing protein n=1 Tax=Micromonospora luteifusca TaxID=709860 RepID=A0ABS2LSH3_9ACTN|nr:hypothetical protein [Micromonospora luteifusca]MBM7491080.1 hypothetical protein [Micromonospora luteifusca]
MTERETAIRDRAQEVNRNNLSPETHRGQPHAEGPRFTSRSIDKQLGRATRYARLAAAFGGKIPLIGLPIAVGNVIYDIKEGKSPSQAIVSGALSTTAGTATAVIVGTALGGAAGNVPGAIAGGLVGFGVGALSGLAVDAAWEKWMPTEIEKFMDDALRKGWDAVTPG